jgi:hypothetical protein
MGLPRIVLQKVFRGSFYVKEGWLVIRGACGSTTIFFTVNKSVSKDASVNNRNSLYRLYYFVFYIYFLCRRWKSIDSATVFLYTTNNIFSSICFSLSISFAVLWSVSGLRIQETAGPNVAFSFRYLLQFSDHISLLTVHATQLQGSDNDLNNINK